MLNMSADLCVCNLSNQKYKPCTDVYWFPLVNDEFCDDMLAVMEAFGDWSPGRDQHVDPRLASGYENVPTVDIQMKQIGFEEQWFHFLRNIIAPMQEKIFSGFTHLVSHDFFLNKYSL